MAKAYSKTEKDLLNVFSAGAKFQLDGRTYTIVQVGKPRPSSGECKTDLYVSCECGPDQLELKISIKQENADFVENKMNLATAQRIFGADTQRVLTAALLGIKSQFVDHPIVYYNKKGKTDEKCITLGWKFELFDKQCGNKSGRVDKATDEHKYEAYAGNKLPEDKRNCKVKGSIIENSGVANYILRVDNTNIPSLQDCVDSLTPIHSYAEDSDLYFACKAINFRMEKDKWDGNRPLAVYVDWQIDDDGKLCGKIVFDKPLVKHANEIGNNLRTLLKKLKIDKDNFNDLAENLCDSVKTHRND